MKSSEKYHGLIKSRRDALIAVCLTGFVGVQSFSSAMSNAPAQWFVPLDSFPMPMWSLVILNLAFYLCILWGGVVLFRLAQGTERIVVAGWFGVLAVSLVQHVLPVSSIGAVRWVKAAGMAVAFVMAVNIFRESWPDATQDSVSKPISASLRLFLAATAGTLASVLLLSISPAPRGPSVLQPNPYPNGPGLVGIIHYLQAIYSSPYFGVPVVLIFTFLAITRRDQKQSWIYAFLVGGSLPGILFHWVFHWI